MFGDRHLTFNWCVHTTDRRSFLWLHLASRSWRSRSCVCYQSYENGILTTSEPILIPIVHGSRVWNDQLWGSQDQRSKVKTPNMEARWRHSCRLAWFEHVSSFCCCAMLCISATDAVVRWPAGCLSVTYVYCVETAKYRSKYVWNANICKPYPRFRTVPFSSTLNDLERVSKIFNDTKHARPFCDSWSFYWTCSCAVFYMPKLT